MQLTTRIEQKIQLFCFYPPALKASKVPTSFICVFPRYSSETSIVAADLQKAHTDPLRALGTAKSPTRNVAADFSAAEEWFLFLPRATCRVQLALIPSAKIVSLVTNLSAVRLVRAVS